MGYDQKPSRKIPIGFNDKKPSRKIPIGFNDKKPSRKIPPLTIKSLFDR
jgi:hypothetical protein